jgi:hypothetical protein
VPNLLQRAHRRIVCAKSWGTANALRRGRPKHRTPMAQRAEVNLIKAPITHTAAVRVYWPCTESPRSQPLAVLQVRQRTQRRAMLSRLSLELGRRTQESKARSRNVTACNIVPNSHRPGVKVVLIWRSIEAPSRRWDSLVRNKTSRDHFGANSCTPPNIP